MGNEGINQNNGGVKIVRTTSTFDCGGRCPIKLHVKDNRILRIEGDDIAEPEQLRTLPNRNSSEPVYDAGPSGSMSTIPND
jgi:anaerobic selenocysteine-containing dehydrogenase